MTTTQGEHAQPEALRLAECFEDNTSVVGAARIASELRRLHAAHQNAQANVTLLADILNRRPAMNAGLAEAYAHWTAEVYDLMAAMACKPANDAAPAQPAAPQGGAYAELTASLRAMAAYPLGHCWDSLDAAVCVQAAAALDALRASNGQAPAGAAHDWIPFSKRMAIADRHGIKVTAEFNSLVRDIIRTYLDTPPPTAQPAPAADKMLAYETALAELVDKITGADSGDILADALAASKALDERAAPAAGAVAGPTVDMPSLWFAAQYSGYDTQYWTIKRRNPAWRGGTEIGMNGNCNPRRFKTDGAAQKAADELNAAAPTPAAPHPIAPDVAADLERSDWTPEEALRWYAAGKHYDTVPNGDGSSSARILDNGAVASNALKSLSRDYAEHKGDVALMEAPAAGAVAGPVETVQFANKSKATALDKARIYLKAMGDQSTNNAYFFDDGYPRRESAQDALATLAVLEQLAAAPTPAAQQGDAEDAADPLQGAANWLNDALVNCNVRDIQHHLFIGYNRAKRLHDAALAQKEATHGN